MDHDRMIDTRGTAHEFVISKGVPSKQQAKVLACLAEADHTRDELHEATGISVTSLCARIKELVDANRVEVVAQITHPTTRRMVNVYRANGTT